MTHLKNNPQSWFAKNAILLTVAGTILSVGITIGIYQVKIATLEAKVETLQMKFNEINENLITNNTKLGMLLDIYLSSDQGGHGKQADKTK